MVKNHLAVVGPALLAVSLAVVAGYIVAMLFGGATRVTIGPAEAAATAAALQFEVDGTVLPAPDGSAPARTKPPVEPASAVQAAAAPARATPRPAATMQPAGASPAPLAPTRSPARASASPAMATPSSVAMPVGAGGEVFVQDIFDTPATGWPVRSTGDWLTNYVDGTYETRLTGDTPAGLAFPMAGHEYRIAVDVEVEAGAAGLVFLYGEPSSYYWAGVGADGSFGVERIDGDQVTPVMQWKTDPSVPRDGKPARIILERQGDLLSVTVGAAQLAQLAVPSGRWQNRYGFVVSPRNGQAIARFDNLIGKHIR